MTKRRIDDERLALLWSLGVPDKEIAARLGHHRGVIRRRAAALGLPSLSAVRARWGAMNVSEKWKYIDEVAGPEKRQH